MSSLLVSFLLSSLEFFFSLNDFVPPALFDVLLVETLTFQVTNVTTELVRIYWMQFQILRCKKTHGLADRSNIRVLSLVYDSALGL